MDDKILKDLLERQGKAIATLAIRITTLEEILLEKKTITEDEVAAKALKLSKEFVSQTQESLQKVLEQKAKESNGD